MSKLTAAKLRTLTKPGTYGDGGGLYVQVRAPKNRSWLYRYKIHGKGHLMGLGTVEDVTLAQAREAAQTARRLVRQGIDPIDQRKSQRVEAMARRGLNTFAEVAEAFIAAHEDSWRNARHRQQWRNTLETYISPAMKGMGVALVDMAAVMRVLEPIWKAKPETASRVRGRIEAVLDYAKARGWRSGENPARWRGHLDSVLPAPAKIARVKHHAALPWRDAGEFMATLTEQRGVAALALRFTILTATRTGEVIGARWSEIDMQQAIWTIPAERMKAQREHRVPLSDGAVMVLQQAAELRADNTPTAFVFPGQKLRSGLSNMAMFVLLRRMGRADLTTHGFRSTFRDWCAESTNYPRELAEAALAHTLKDKTEAAYQRGDIMDKRRRLMAEWAKFCSQPYASNGEFVQLRVASHL